jgi:phospholipase C
MPAKTLLVVATLALLTLAGCTSNGAPSGGGALSGGVPSNALRALPEMRPATGHPVGQYISHVIVIVQENRSFENFFAGYPGANAPMYGCIGPGGQLHKAPAPAQPRRGTGSGCPPSDQQVPLHPITFNGPDLRHDWYSAITSYDNGKMDDFWRFGQQSGIYSAYAYVQQSLIQPYWTMANQYVLADAMYPTEFGGSFTGHLTLVAGTDSISYRPTRSEVDFPSAVGDCDAPPGTTTSYVNTDRNVHRFQGPFPCFTQFNTMAEVLDKARVSWRYYVDKRRDAGLWSPFEAIKYVRYGRDWDRKIVVPETQVLNDASQGKLASVSWVTPSKPNSDHPGDKSPLGPSWVASVVNAIGESPYWNSSAIIVLWDDWGGWYDNANPPDLDYRGLGIRVPCLIISPYARETSPSQPGYVSHTQYEFGSILKFIEEAYNLPYIGSAEKGYTDERANPLDDSFDFTQPPRPFVPISSKHSKSYFLHQRPSQEPVDTE